MLRPWVLLWLPLAFCEIFDLGDSTPWLVSAGGRVTFSSGWDAFVVADSSCVRVSARGVQAKPSHWTPRALGPTWTSRACAPGPLPSLCELSDGSLAFPEPSLARLPAYNASRAWGGLECTRQADGRVMDPSYAYDVSACDVLDGGDAVLCGRTLSFARTGLSEWAYWALCVIAVFLTRSLSHLVVERASRHARQGGFWEDLLVIASCVAVIPLSLLPNAYEWLVTDEDYVFYLVMCVYAGTYVLLYAVYCCGSQYSDPPIYNLIAATLQLIASRLYLSAETPYNTVIIWAISTRALMKLRSHQDQWVVGFTTLFDSLVLSLMCVLGFTFDSLYLVPIFCLSLCTSDALISIKAN